MPGPNTDRRLPPCIQFVSHFRFGLDSAGVGLLLVNPGVVTESAGLVLIVAVVLMQNLRSR